MATRQQGLDLLKDDNLNSLAMLIAKLYSDREIIASALAYTGGTHTFDDVAEMIIKGKLIYWHLDNSCIVGEVLNYPQTKDLHFFLSCGKLEEIVAMQSTMVETAQKLGCGSMSITGRSGWVKPLGKLGWTVHSQTMVFDVENCAPDTNPIDDPVDTSVDGPHTDPVHSENAPTIAKEKTNGRRRKRRTGEHEDRA